jgi:hypothetical protein
MDVDPAATMVSMLAARTQQLTQIAVIKEQHQMQMDLIARLAEVARSAPPPGTGTVVDRTA